jgi:hypothetical protein
MHTAARLRATAAQFVGSSTNHLAASAAAPPFGVLPLPWFVVEIDNVQATKLFASQVN